MKLGIDDPEQWLEDVPRRVLDVWRGYFAVEPFGMENVLAAKLCELTSASFAAAVGSSDCMIKASDVLPACWVLNEPEQTPDLASQLDALERAVTR